MALTNVRLAEDGIMERMCAIRTCVIDASGSFQKMLLISTMHDIEF